MTYKEIYKILNKNIPKDSKGSLKYHLWEVSESENLTTYHVMISGDLEGYISIEEIKTWFKQITIDSEIIIRDAILSVSESFADKRVLFINAKKNDMKYIKSIFFKSDEEISKIRCFLKK